MVPIRCCRRDFFRRAAVGGLALRAGRMERVGAGHCGQLLLPVLPGHGPAAHDAGKHTGVPARYFAAAAFAVLLILGQLGSVGLAGNGYSSPIFLLLASLAGWVLVREAACLTAPLPCVRAVLAYLGRATMPIVILHFLSFKLVTWLGLLATGGEPYLLAAFPIYFTGGVWWLAYTAAGLVLPLAANAVYKKIKIPS